MGEIVIAIPKFHRTSTKNRKHRNFLDNIYLELEEKPRKLSECDTSLRALNIKALNKTSK